MNLDINRNLSVKANTIEINAATSKKNAWIKVMVPDDFAKALMRDWMGNEVEGASMSLENVMLVWKDMQGLTFAESGKSLRELLRENILDRYDNPEYHDVFMDDEDASSEGLTENILDRYDNGEYWEADIAMEFMDNEYISDEDMELIRYMIPDDEIAVKLLTQKNL